MKRYVLRRVALAIPTLFLVSVIVFAMMRLMPGDVATRMVEGHAYAPTLAALRKDLGLDRPVYIQYTEWISGIVLRGDFGNSYWTRQPIWDEFVRRFPVTRAGPIMRIMRSSLLDVLRQEYIRTAWSKGLSERTIVLRHALKNALIPVISLIGLQMPLYIGGSVIIEAIFRLPGVGLFFFEALGKLDYPVVQSVNLIIAAMVVGLNLLIDLSYAFLDPRIRY